jgi:hypothetical protein
MIVHRPRLLGLLVALLPLCVYGQIDESELGAWYMYMWSATSDQSRFGFQGDVQHRNWDRSGDLEQFLVRGGATWVPPGWQAKLTLGYAHVTSGEYGASGAKSRESRVYQEVLATPRVGQRIFLTHRVRVEQRWVDEQDFRNRLRYFFGINYPFNQDSLARGAWYLSFYNELFLNFERDIGAGRRVDRFDRNRAYVALGYSASDSLRLQAGYMFQQTETVGKGQLQFNLLQSF